MAFENSLCDDYATEKVFKVLRKYYTIPIVMGPSLDWYTKNLPPKSFIHVEQFDYSPEKLVDHLNYLLSNHTAFEEYLTWKLHYHEVPREPRIACEVCQYLHERKKKLQESNGDIQEKPLDFYKYFMQTGCYNPWTNHKVKHYRRKKRSVKSGSEGMVADYQS